MIWQFFLTAGPFWCAKVVTAAVTAVKGWLPVSTGMITYSGNPSQLQQYVTANTGTSSDSTVSIAGTSAGSIPAGLDLAGATENGDQQAADSITLDVGFSTPDTVNFTAEIVPGGTSTGTPFSNNISVVASALPPGNNFIGLTMTIYDDYSNTTDKQYTTGPTSSSSFICPKTLSGNSNTFKKPSVAHQSGEHVISLLFAIANPAIYSKLT